MNLYHDLTCYKRANRHVETAPVWLSIITWIGASAVTGAIWYVLAILIFSF